jgi:hypothetical protein
MDARAGGCFCEKWKRGSVEHLRVVWATAPSELRLRGGLGPLQGMGVEGLLTIEIAPQAAGATIRMSYRVSGDSLQSLTALAPVVDGVLAAQLASLKSLLDGPPPGALRD